MLERWQPEDRAELCYRALFRSRGDDGGRLSLGLADLEGGMFDAVRRQIYRERDSQIADHLQQVFSAAKWDTLRLATGISLNVFRWFRDTFKYDWAAVREGNTKAQARVVLAPGSDVQP